MREKTKNMCRDIEAFLDADIDIKREDDFWEVLARKYEVSAKRLRNLAGQIRRERQDPVDLHLTVSLSDLHIPFEDKAALEAIEQFLEDQEPDELVLNGDIIDAFSISNFTGDPRKPRIQQEIEQARDYLERWRSMLPDTNITYLAGNHGERIERFVREHPGLIDLKALQLDNLLGLDDLDIDYYDYMVPYDVGEITYVHGNKVSKHASYAAKRTLLDGGYENIVVGHTHRIGHYRHVGHEGTRRAWEQGHLSDASKASYIQGVPNWSSGFFYALHDDMNLVDANVIEIIDNRFHYGGKLYG